MRIYRLLGAGGEWVGIQDYHRTSEGRLCGGYALFDLPAAQIWADEYVGGSTEPRWQVTAWEPLTLSPSLQCGRCGHHGNIVQGRWQPA